MFSSLFQTALIYTEDIQEDNINHLEPRYPVSMDDIRRHFEREIKKWISSEK
jgi:hypothetical protein